jgi:uncharacterized membrane protein
MVERTPHGRESLNSRIDRYREVWMRRMLGREQRMVDMQVMIATQNGTAFFASTSLIAIGGALTLLRSTEELISVVSPLGITTSRGLWEVKTIGLAVIFAYAFFKFAWSYRLYNYVAILLGASPPHPRRTPQMPTRMHAAPRGCSPARDGISIAGSGRSSSPLATSAGSSGRWCCSPAPRPWWW